MKTCLRFVTFALLAAVSLSVKAVPVLQLYVEGASYDTEHESWVFAVTDGDPIRLWVIGNISGPGGKGAIEGVKLSIVYPDPLPGDSGSAVSINITPTTTGGFGGFTDPGTPTPPAPIHLQTDEAGNIPILYDGKTLATHGVYGDGWEWQEFMLGDFATPDSPGADFIYQFPDPVPGSDFQINAYEITVTGPASDLHFDAYDHVQSKNHAKAVFAPFSHDAGTGINERLPEPGTLALLALGLFGLYGVSVRRQPRRVVHRA